MKAALIPPIPMLQRFGTGHFHLLLSHLLPDRRYFDHYAWQRQNGAYLVLDNSAHEAGEGDDAEMLLFNAAALRAQEVVVPDVLDDGPATVERGIQALETWFEGTSKVNSRVIHELAPALMYVPQGRHLDEYKECLLQLARLHLYVAQKYEYRRDFVLGISKDYEKWDGGLMALIQDVIKPEITRLRDLAGIKVQVHMLGWGRDLWALEEIAKKHQWIRSTDSAKPFVYALKGVNLVDAAGKTVPKYPRRPKGYFNKQMNEQQQGIAVQNARVFRAAANGSLQTLPSI